MYVFGHRRFDGVCAPAVAADPDLLRDWLSAEVFGGTPPALTVVRAASTYEDSLIVIKLTAFKSSR